VYCFFSHFHELLQVAPEQKFDFFKVFNSLKIAKLLEIELIFL
jgi:hypothetical protein